MIYFVDEDVIQLEPFKIELRIQGYEVENIINADEAFDVLSKTNNDLRLAIIDVMLAADENPGASKYDRAKTRDYLQTGLCLLKDLIEVRPDIFPKRALLFSMASDRKLITEIDKVSKDYKIPFLNKNDYTSAVDFGVIIDKHIRALGGHQ